MNRLVLINSVCGFGSTGKICALIAEEYENKGWDVKLAYGRSHHMPEQLKRFAIQIGTKWDNYFHGLETRLFDRHGYGSKGATKRFLQWLEEYDPDLLWLHNIHGYYINFELLFEWIKRKKNLKVKWTLHDCWPFTGHCVHFSAVNCKQWKTGCEKCCQKRMYPASYFLDYSHYNYLRKKSAFCDVQDMEIIVPSQWLKNLVQESYLNKYPITVMPNPIDRKIFMYRNSDLRKKLGAENKTILLGVSYIWDERKGYNDFLQLAGMLDDSFVIVLVGLNRKQKNGLPDNIIGLDRTENQVRLAELYSAADYFINLSVEETFGMTTLEALACGTRAIVYSDTACEEVAAQHGGFIVPKGDIRAVYRFLLEGNQ